MSRPKFDTFGPWWQAECQSCLELSDPFGTKHERDRWTRTHRCTSGLLAVEELMEALRPFADGVDTPKDRQVARKLLRRLDGCV